MRFIVRIVLFCIIINTISASDVLETNGKFGQRTLLEEEAPLSQENNDPSIQRNLSGSCGSWIWLTGKIYHRWTNYFLYREDYVSVESWTRWGDSSGACSTSYQSQTITAKLYTYDVASYPSKICENTLSNASYVKTSAATHGYLVSSRYAYWRDLIQGKHIAVTPYSTLSTTTKMGF